MAPATARPWPGGAGSGGNIPGPHMSQMRTCALSWPSSLSLVSRSAGWPGVRRRQTCAAAERARQYAPSATSSATLSADACVRPRQSKRSAQHAARLSAAGAARPPAGMPHAYKRSPLEAQVYMAARKAIDEVNSRDQVIYNCVRQCPLRTCRPHRSDAAAVQHSVCCSAQQPPLHPDQDPGPRKTHQGGLPWGRPALGLSPLDGTWPWRQPVRSRAVARMPFAPQDGGALFDRVPSEACAELHRRWAACHAKHADAGLPAAASGSPSDGGVPPVEVLLALLYIALSEGDAAR